MFTDDSAIKNSAQWEWVKYFNVLEIGMLQSGILFFSHFYRPQTKFAKVMFLHMSVCQQAEWYPSMPCRWYPSMPCRFPGPHLGGAWGVWLGGGKSPGPHPGGKLSGLAWGGGVSRPTPRGRLRVWPGGLQAHTQGGSPSPHLVGVFQHVLRQTPLTATAAGGTHPTGMHSCVIFVYSIVSM